jgi:hypothetical protein
MTTSANSAIGDLVAPWTVFIPEPGKYILRFSHNGYETKCLDFTYPANRSKRNLTIIHAPVYLKHVQKEKIVELNEVVVKATKVKFFYRGDTVVYNADAFQLAEGSMLDGLVRQLPGVELKDDGRIYVNGRYVESLLLNGEDFFKKDRSILLDNLPAYTVQNVKVYEKQGKLGEMMGRKIGDQSLVMDVNLKKQYAIGWMGNVEGAAGTHDRYLARLFALRFTAHSRVSAFASLNNINEVRKPGSDNDWNPSDIGTGLTATKLFGGDYLVNDRNRRFKLSGDVAVRHSNDDFDNHSAGENFLSGGDTYSRSHYNQQVRNTSVISNHNFDFNWSTVKVNIQPSLFYVDHHDRMGSLSGTFGSDPSACVAEGVLDSLLLPMAGNTLRRITLNRNLRSSLTDSRTLNTGINGTATFKMPFADADRLVLNAGGAFTDNTDNTFRHNRTDYPSAENARTDYRNEYDKSPYRSNSFSAKASYWYWPTGDNSSITPYYEYGHSYSYGKRSLYRLDRLTGWDADSDSPIGELPSVEDWRRQTLDGWNSRYEHRTDNHHTVGLQIKKEPFRTNNWRWGVDLPLRFESNRLDYNRPSAIDTVFTRHIVLFSPSMHVGTCWHEQTRQIEFNYSSTASAPGMTDLIDVRDDSNPLNTVYGNADLKNIRSHSMSLDYQDYNRAKQRTLGVNLGYNIVQNAVAMGYVYDRTTGRRTSMPDNVNGNWSANASVECSMPLDKARHITLNTGTSTSFYNSVDLMSTVDDAALLDRRILQLKRSAVHNFYLTENLRTEYHYGKYTVGVKARASWTNATSRRADFSTINAADISYGVKGQAELPWGFQLSTDLTMFTRRGYADKGMNTDDLVWNARLAKRVMHGNLTFLLDGFDLLHQLSNVQRELNGQGRTETYYNVIPRYAMLHVIYRLNRQPKKK